MKYLISDPSTIETRLPNLYRYTSSGRDAERWDPASRKWISIGWANNRANVVTDELDRGSYGMRIPDLAEVAAITGTA
jgi:hypothetical protein